jgi:hypothetical protein
MKLDSDPFPIIVIEFGSKKVLILIWPGLQKGRMLLLMIILLQG